MLPAALGLLKKKVENFGILLLTNYNTVDIITWSPRQFVSY